MSDMLVRLKRGKKTYEVLVHEGSVSKYRTGALSRLDDVLMTPVVFLNATKGTKASTEQLEASFQTTDVDTILDTIIRTGEAQESAGERKSRMDAKRAEIITAIHKTYATPDGKPLPLVRIENALAQIRPKIEVTVDAERQAEKLYPRLREVMAMKRVGGGMEGTVTVGADVAGAVGGVIRKHATVQRESYGAKVKYDVEIHAYDLMMKDLARVTKGDFEVVLATGVEAAAGAAPAAGGNDAAEGGRKKKKKGKAQGRGK